MKVLLDHCVPRQLLKLLPGYDVRTTRMMRWDDLSNGYLIAAANEEFDVMITSDKNLRYQQNLSTRQIALIILPTNYLPTVLSMASQVIEALQRVQPGHWEELPFPPV